MNSQSHMTGQISRQVPNQLGMPQGQNGNVLQPAQMQNLVGGVSACVGLPQNQVKSSEVLKMRRDMLNKIFGLLQQGKPEIGDAAKSKLMLFARRLEEGLAKMAPSKEAYLDVQNLEARIRSLIKLSRRHANASSSVGTLITTPRTSCGGNSNVVALSTAGTSTIASNGVHGDSFTDQCHQSSATFSYGSGATIPSMGAQGPPSQMVPTPGFSNNSANSNFQSHMNVETSSNCVGLSAVESIVASPSQRQNHHTVGQNGHILHSPGSQLDTGFRSGLQQKYLGMNSNNVQLANEPSFENLVKHSKQSFDPCQQSVMHGYATSNSDSFGSGNLYGSVTSTLSTPTTQNKNSVSLNSVSRANSSSVSNQSNLCGVHQVLQIKSESLDQLENMSFRSSLPPRGNLPLAQQQQTYQFQHQLQFAHQQFQQSQNQQQQNLLNENGSGHSQLAFNVVTQLEHEHRAERHNEVLQSREFEQFQPHELQNQFQQNPDEDPSEFAHHASVATGRLDICPSVPPHSQQMPQTLHQHHLPLTPHNYSSSFSIGPQPDSVQGQQPSQSQYWTQLSENSSGQKTFCQRMPGQRDTQCYDVSVGVCTIGQTLTPRSILGIPNPSDPSVTPNECGKENHDPNYRNQQKWLLYLWHVRKNAAYGGNCQDPNVITAQKLLRHLDDCRAPDCVYPRCRQTKDLIDHFKKCENQACPVCVFVKNFLQQYVKSKSRLSILKTGSSQSYESAQATDREISGVPSDDFSKLQPSLKRLKVEQSSKSVVVETEGSAISVSATSAAHSSQDVQQNDYQQSDLCTTVKSDVNEISVEVYDASGKGNPGIIEVKKDIAEGMPKQGPDDEPVTLGETVCLPNEKTIKLEKQIRIQTGESATQSMEIVAGSKSSKSKIKGVSLIELFIPVEVREHICGLRQWVGQSKAKAEKNQAMERSMTKDACQLCAVERLAFEPTPVYCIPCGARIKRNAMYYTMGAGENRHLLCIPCYNECRGDTIVIEGTSILKAKFEKKKNDEEIEEWWVQCDKCEAWQHQICALFNGRMNDGQAEYTCPNCYIQEVEGGERKPLPQSAVLGAKDLPKTILSDHIEQRLFESLRQERQERAGVQGKNYDEVPGAEALVVRVVSSVDKKLEVKPHFLEVFQEENYPTEFPYKSKAILLFQKIEGVEVCLFAMYVQEFGSECAFPNQRRVYLSYLDSVKYFRPDVKTVTGQALRTFVYHEILIGYLEYCKKRGFTSCYIWACPPLKGEDYILYCHPEIQKTPKSDKLREWYLSMIRKAAKEKVVVESVNLYDHFFMQTGERRAKVTAARLPYFDGDYWPGAAEDLIYQINQEDDGKKSNKKGSTKKTISKRALKATGHSNLSVNASKDLLLMHKLGATISPMKEDFIMVHLQHCCTHCCILMVSGSRWACNQCKNFQICDGCYEVERNREERERHPFNQKEKHTLHPVAITDIPTDTKDKDEILESEFFDTRQSFLSLCQGNHYQYDTLRRAKHSSMMVLYHLHNPTAPAFAATCCECQHDIETGQAWHCEVCPDYDVCIACYSKGINHPHKLTNHPSTTDAQNQDARQQRINQLKEMLDLLVHASSCRAQCQYPNCRKLKGLFRHGIRCLLRASGGCPLCKKIWSLLQYHARSCKDSNCSIPRCRDLNNHWRRQQQQADSRRRAAVTEMMRERAAEAASTCV